MIVKNAGNDFEKVLLISMGGYYSILSNYYLGRKETAFDLINKSLKDDCNDQRNQQNAYINQACLYSLEGNQAEAIKSLKNAFEKGYNDFSWIENDEDLDNIRTSPEFKDLINTYKNK